MKDWVAELAAVAGFVVAIGDCATFGGIPATAPKAVLSNLPKVPRRPWRPVES